MKVHTKVNPSVKAVWRAAIAAIALFAVGAGALGEAQATHKDFLLRLRADRGPIDEQLTTLGVPGVQIYQRTVFVPQPHNVVYVTLSTTGDTHGGAASWFTCNVNGAPCDPRAGGAAGAPAGWIALQKIPAGGANANCNDGGGGAGDCHDNSIYYQWCARVAEGTHTVELRMASSAPPNIVFIEKAHYYVDSSRVRGRNRCR